VDSYQWSGTNLVFVAGAAKWANFGLILGRFGALSGQKWPKKGKNRAVAVTV
jgi:hypothetical protein